MTPKHLLEYQKEYRKKNRKLISEKNKQKRHKRLLEAIQLLGGACKRCAQSFDPCVYDFHHVNADTKNFTIGENMLVGKDKFFAEIKKCILVCANCHRLIHKESTN